MFLLLNIFIFIFIFFIFSFKYLIFIFIIIYQIIWIFFSLFQGSICKLSANFADFERSFSRQSSKTFKYNKLLEIYLLTHLFDTFPMPSRETINKIIKKRKMIFRIFEPEFLKLESPKLKIVNWHHNELFITIRRWKLSGVSVK